MLQRVFLSPSKHQFPFWKHDDSYRPQKRLSQHGLLPKKVLTLQRQYNRCKYETIFITSITILHPDDAGTIRHKHDIQDLRNR